MASGGRSNASICRVSQSSHTLRHFLAGVPRRDTAMNTVVLAPSLVGAWLLDTRPKLPASGSLPRHAKKATSDSGV